MRTSEVPSGPCRTSSSMLHRISLKCGVPRPSWIRARNFMTLRSSFWLMRLQVE